MLNLKELERKLDIALDNETEVSLNVWMYNFTNNKNNKYNMSYEPTLVIKKSDLDKHSQDLENFYFYDERNDEQRVMQYLQDIYRRYDVVKIDDLELILCTPEFSTFNRLVREKLTSWGVQFGESN